MTFIDVDGNKIAVEQTEGQGRGVMFLGGYRSDMTGTKALDLISWAKEGGHVLTRFDYSGHGASGGAFTDGTISQWAKDAAAVLERTEGPQILVGSSMGGWISLLLARAIPQKIAGLVLIAPAPDFTEQMYQTVFTDTQRKSLARDGKVEIASDYSPDPDIFTQQLIEDGRRNLVMSEALPIEVPVRILQGAADAEVPMAWAVRLLEHISGEDVRLTVVKGADHRFSSPACLTLIRETLDQVVGAG